MTSCCYDSARCGTEVLGQELAKVIEEFGMVTRPARRGANVVTTRPGGGVVTETLALGNEMVTTGGR